jgi:hypothetical protein
MSHESGIKELEIATKSTIGSEELSMKGTFK